MSSKSSYMYCYVPYCKNTSYATPEKLFFFVPKGDIREKWNEKVKRHKTSLYSPLSICEDHFNLEEDVQDWRRYKILKEAGQKTFALKLKSKVLPSIFDCQPARKSCHSKPTRSVIQKKQMQEAVKEALKEDAQVELKTEVESSVSEHDDQADFSDPLPGLQNDNLDLIYTIGDKLCRDFACQINMIENIQVADFGCQVRFKPIVRSKETQTPAERPNTIAALQLGPETTNAVITHSAKTPKIPNAAITHSAETPKTPNAAITHSAKTPTTANAVITHSTKTPKATNAVITHPTEAPKATNAVERPKIARMINTSSAIGAKRMKTTTTSSLQRKIYTSSPVKGPMPDNSLENASSGPEPLDSSFIPDSSLTEEDIVSDFSDRK